MNEYERCLGRIDGAGRRPGHDVGCPQDTHPRLTPACATDIADLSKHTANVNVAWVRIAPWLPWMKMGGRAGFTYFNAVGAKLNSWDDLPALMKDEINANYPAYTSPPPGDDTRPNETSWTYFKKYIDGQGN